jgi:hypothetical protein
MRDAYILLYACQDVSIQLNRLVINVIRKFLPFYHSVFKLLFFSRHPGGSMCHLLDYDNEISDLTMG